MAFPFFTEDEQPTMENFNEKFRAILGFDTTLISGSYKGTYTGTSALPDNKTIYLGENWKICFVLIAQTSGLPKARSVEIASTNNGKSDVIIIGQSGLFDNIVSINIDSITVNHNWNYYTNTYNYFAIG